MSQLSAAADFSALDAAAVFFRPASADDLEAVYALERISYPSDEAATFEKLQHRIKHAGDVFLVAVRSSSLRPASGGDVISLNTPAATVDEVVGFVCATRSSARHLTHQSMSEHEVDGTTLCIHSVVVDPQLRRRGLARRMLRAYLQYVALASAPPQLRAVHLISKQDLLPLYQSVGFHLLGPSVVVHGADPWFELAYSIPGNDGVEEPHQ